jgi:hypothetical protein
VTTVPDAAPTLIQHEAAAVASSTGCQMVWDNQKRLRGALRYRRQTEYDATLSILTKRAELVFATGFRP